MLHVAVGLFPMEYVDYLRIASHIIDNVIFQSSSCYWRKKRKKDPRERILGKVAKSKLKNEMEKNESGKE